MRSFRSFNTIVMVLLIALTLQGCKQKFVERKVLFDYDWTFSLNSDSEWRAVDLPHDWSIEGSFDVNNPAGDAGGYLPGGIGVYKKTVCFGNEYRGKKVMLYFEGGFGESVSVSISPNKETVGTHHYGYSSFAFDLTPYIRIGENQELEVTVDNSRQPNCRWYSGSGLFRHVWLITTNDVHFKHWRNYITTPRVTPFLATVAFETVVENESPDDKTVIVRADIPDGYYVEKTVTVAANSSEKVRLETDIYNPRLWEPTQHPKQPAELYEARFSIREGKKVLDGMTETFGIRSIEYSVEEGFKLNGKPMKIFGGCLHHDNGILGAAAYDRAEERKVEMMKAAGYNALRTSHNPVSEALLNACDRLGIMVIDEAFDGWYAEKTPYDYHLYIDEHWQDDISALVLRDRNHPSVIAWSIGNEIIERDSPEAVEAAHRFSGLCRELDPTRPVTQAHALWNDKWVGQDALAAEHEIVGYNYLLDLAPTDHKRVPNRIIWQTESYPRDVYKNWKLMSENPYIIGDFVWTSLDYIGESSIGRWYYEGETPGEHYQGTHFPWHGAYCGDIDLTGWRKPVSYYRQVMFAPKTAEEVHLAVKEPDGYYGKIRETQWSVWPTWDSWNWPGWEGKPIEVEVYSIYPEVKLFLDDEEITTFVKNNHVLTTFTLPYKPGSLTAVGVYDDDYWGNTTLSTADEPAAFHLISDRTDAVTGNSQLKADGQDLAFITVEVLDKNGYVCPNAEIPFTCSVKGAAEIIAIGNANLQDCDSYKDLSHKTWKGRALIVVKASREAGEATLEISSPSLTGASEIILVK